jgi:purine-binding chemotaxis protein CheW
VSRNGAPASGPHAGVVTATAGTGASSDAPSALPIAQIVTFRIAQDLFAADVRAVERVLRPMPPTPVRNVPGWITGVIEYRKRVVPVIDFRVRFELAPAPTTNDTRVLVFNAAGNWVAGVVDAVLDVSVLDGARLEPPPPLFRGLAGEYLRGIVRRDTCCLGRPPFVADTLTRVQGDPPDLRRKCAEIAARLDTGEAGTEAPRAQLKADIIPVSGGGSAAQ